MTDAKRDSDDGGVLKNIQVKAEQADVADETKSEKTSVKVKTEADDLADQIKIEKKSGKENRDDESCDTCPEDEYDEDHYDK